jgi:hypothetical protein
MELAQILYEIYDTPIDGDPTNAPIYCSWGYKTYSDYAKKELGLLYNKAVNLRRIWYVLEVELADLDPMLKKRLTELGWTKVKEVTRVLTLQNAEKWVEAVETMTFNEVRQAVTAYRVELEQKLQEAAIGNGELPSLEVLSEKVAIPVEKIFYERFALYKEQQEVVQQAIQKASELSGSGVKSNNLHLICMDFLATNDFTKGIDSRIRLLSKLEKLLNLQLVVVEEGDVVYGLDILKKLAEQ